ncbi:DUF3527 domain-containing protein [Cephalotus follicularis]|uniref:DUF3527 domain-containing protein n=1 Tax=Cephalotus follicularis TaxID=3775 RepID=A0A1Q3BBP6_CEPFO|nr:DUF3527 domain-containing protein [Cephalotus follicularis]
MVSNGIKPRNDYSEPSGDRGFSLQLKKSTKQIQNSKIVKERVHLPQENDSLKCQGKLKVKEYVDPQFIDLPNELIQDADDRLLVRTKSSGDSQRQCLKGKTAKDDELVKYMSNLPGYLQCVEKGENSKEKAFNVGVLDWARLEKWKHQKHIPARGGNNGSSGSSNLPSKKVVKSSAYSGAVHSKTHIDQSEQHPSHCSSLDSSQNDGHSRGVKPSAQKVVRFQDLETASKSNLDDHKSIPWTSKSFGRNSDVTLENEKRTTLDQKFSSKMGNSSSNLRDGPHILIPKGNLNAGDAKAKKRVEEVHGSDKITLGMEDSSSKLGSYGVPLSSRRKLSARNDKNKKRELLDSVDLGHHHCPGEPKNIVFLLPQKVSQNSSFGEHQTSLNKYVTEVNQNSFSGHFSTEVVNSLDLHSVISHSFPQPSKVETNIQPDMMVQSLINSVGAKLLSPDTSKVPKVLSDTKHAEQDNNISTNAVAVETLKTLDQDLTELQAKRDRSHSPNRRFSFLSRMGRSFSFKEGSDIPHFSSTHVSIESDPVRFEGSACLENTDREKVNRNNRARSSPFRRMLDPLLKSKRFHSHHSSGIVHPLKGSLINSFRGRHSNVRESLQETEDAELGSLSPETLSDGKASSMIQAVLQIRIRNERPLFKFMVENSGTILAATMKNMASSGKDDLDQNYTFYSVDEIEKKSGRWISQRSKAKSCGYAYNTVGQMKVFCPHFINLSGENPDHQSMVRESILYETRQVDQAEQKFMPNRELAAIVVKMFVEDLSDDKNAIVKTFPECFPEDGRPSNLGENKNPNSFTVILPGGDHGLPTKGVPSTLIHRWKTGGSCDCGGWDLGCQLLVLSNQNRCPRIPRTLKAWKVSDCFELFVQGECQLDRPLFSLEPLAKGIYSVEFNSSVSLLQAFFICVTVLSCQGLSDLAETSDQSEAKVSQKISTVVQGEVPAKVAPHQPISLLGGYSYIHA